MTCTAPTGFVGDGNDCDDSDPFTFPGAAENEPNGAGMCMTDADEDGYGSNTSTVAVVGTDCDDSDAAINPAATEIGNNSVDEDCEGRANYNLLQVGLGLGVACAVDNSNGTDGALVCWGSNSSSQILTSVPNGSNFVQVEVGESDACALDASGYMTCWGDATIYDSTHATNIPFQDLSLGATHGCALKDAAGTGGGYDADCWGQDCTLGQCPEPTPGMGGLRIEYLGVAAGGLVSCGIQTTTGLSCWGDNLSEVYQQSISLSDYYFDVDLATNTDAACMLKADSSITCIGNAASRITVDAPTSTGFSGLSCGSASCCALDSNSSLQCWGDDSVPTTGIPGGTNWSQVAVGMDMACAIDGTDQELTCWGALCDAGDPACDRHP